MKKIDRLIREAKDSMIFRKHVPKKAIKDKKQAIILCNDCTGWVQVLTKPWPNEIDIGGNAIAENCPIE